MASALSLYNALSNMAILTILILPVHEHRLSLHFIVSFSIPFIYALWFSVDRSFTSFVKFIPRYFILLVAIEEGIFLTSF